MFTYEFCKTLEEVREKIQEVVTKNMKTIYQIIAEKAPFKSPKFYREIIWLNDWICFLFDHKQIYLSDILGNFRGAFVCRRCHRIRGEHTEEFYHNWEMDYGKFARCHDHA